MTLAEVVEWYERRLSAAGTNGARLAKQFRRRLTGHREAAQAEAAVFHYLEVKNLKPTILEDPSRGGMDFECTFGDEKFAVEVTAFASQTVTNRSGYPDELSEPGYVDLPSIISLVRSRISDKAVQARSYPGPSVLAIGSTHVIGSTIVSAGVEEFLTGEANIAFTVASNGTVGDVHMATTLKNAAYVRATPEGLQSFRSRYALVLFFAIHGGGAHVTGIIHPAPDQPLSITPFRNVPFARLEWPVRDNNLRVEWVIADPRVDVHYFIHL